MFVSDFTSNFETYHRQTANGAKARWLHLAQRLWTSQLEGQVEVYFDGHRQDMKQLSQ